jgi:hypothetical protein
MIFSGSSAFSSKALMLALMMSLNLENMLIALLLPAKRRYVPLYAGFVP